jgi:hypothetical protein
MRRQIDRLDSDTCITITTSIIVDADEDTDEDNDYDADDDRGLVDCTTQARRKHKTFTSIHPLSNAINLLTHHAISNETDPSLDHCIETALTVCKQSRAPPSSLVRDSQYACSLTFSLGARGGKG